MAALESVIRQVYTDIGTVSESYPQLLGWTLVVNKNVSAGNKYGKHLDLVRMGLLMGQLSEPQKEFTVLFGHTEPKQCNMRIYYGKSGTWAEFKEK